ncbi:MAG: hypothetical protein GWP91_10860 [Rhodobacterales bacterium]|nr:hypothetical protein [Rhodobacterales bacterium]
MQTRREGQISNRDFDISADPIGIGASNIRGLTSDQYERSNHDDGKSH